MRSRHPVTMRIYILVAILRRQNFKVVSGLWIGSRLRRLILLGLVSYELADRYQLSPQRRTFSSEELRIN